MLSEYEEALYNREWAETEKDYNFWDKKLKSLWRVSPQETDD